MNQLLEKLNELKIKLFLKGDNLDIQAPKGSVTPNILEEIRNHKSEIISFLKNSSSKTTIQRSEKRENYPLSSTQKRMWLLHQMNPENVAYHIPMIFEIEGNLNIDKLQKTFGYLVKRHESLRTIFQEDDLGNPIQIIKEFSEDLFQLNFIDSNIKENIQNEINTPFDLKKDVLLRGTVFKTADNKYLLMVVIHHIISDGWSIEVLAKDFFEIYKNVDNEDFNFEDLKIQYKDYAVWQQEKLKTQNPDKEYWLSVFNGEIPILELPSYKTRLKYKSGKGNTISAQLGAQELSLFQKLCFDNGATLFMGIKSLVDILLFKYSHQNEIIVGTPIANREYPELQDQIGFYANTLALKANIDSSYSFLNLLNNNKSQLLEAYKHQEYPFDELVANLKLSHDPSRNPLFDVMVSLQEKSEDITSQLENLTIKKLIPEDHTSKFDLTFNFYIEDSQLNLELTYDTEIYDEKFARGLIKHLSNLLSEVVENEKSLVKDIDIITSEERHQLLVDFNDTKVDYPSDKTIVELFEEQMEKTPDNVAVVFENIELTYRLLNEESNQLGDYLRQNYHIKPDDLVAIKLERSEKMIVAILGILKSGAAYVPIDPEYPQERIEYIEHDTKAKVTIDKSFLERFHEELEKQESHYKKDNLPNISRSDSLAYVIYTSGTTGNPKGVMIENRSLVNYILFQTQFLDFKEERVTLLTTYTFDASVEQIFLSLLNNSTLYIVPKSSINEREILESVLESQSITHIHSVPSLLENLDLQNLSSLKRIISAGEEYNKNLSDKYIDKYKLYNKYGPTESTISILIKEIQTKNELSIGAPISNTQVYILDEDLRVVPIGVSGTLYVSGVGLSRGYLNRPELTAEKFIVNPFEEGTKMYDTGDLARWLADGNIEFLGRKDFQVKIRGYRIELGEIETNISQFSFGIKQVVGEAKEVNGEKVLVAYYTKDEDTIIDKTELREYLQSKLPEYMVPGFFVELENIPLTPNGKIDRNALPSVTGEDLIRREYIAPRNATEEKLAEIWQEVLGVEKVGITDNFFELGGNSLMVAQVLNRIHQSLSMQVSFKDFFTSPTIEGISKSLTGKEYTPIPKATEQESYPLTPSQQRLWVLSQLEGGSQAYNMPAVVTLRGELNEVYFEKSFQSLIDRHEILRTSFKSDKGTGEIRQYITPKEKLHFTIEILDFSGKNESEVEDYLQTANNEAFNLEESPLIRASLLRRGTEEHLFFLSMHHIIGDGWSTEVLVSEVVESYNNLLNGNTKNNKILKEELAIQYKDYAVWLQEEIKAEKYQNAETYWLDQFEGELPVLELPSYKTRPLIQTYNGNNISHLFSKEFTDKLKKYSENHGATLFMTLMAGVKALLYRYTGQQDIIVGTPIAGREHPDLENQIGLYLNTLAIRTKLEEEQNTFESILAKEKETLLLAYEHQLYPFDELVSKLNVRRDTSRSALFDVLVVFQNQNQLHLGNKVDEIHDLEITEYKYQRKTSQFDMSYTFAEEGGQLGLTIEYNTDIYDEFLIERMFGHFENLLKKAIEDTEDKVGTTAIEDIDILTSSELHQLLHEFNDTKVDYPSDKTIVQLFEEQVEKTPENVAIVFEDTELTYRELNEQANQLGDYLRKNYDIEADDLVAIKLERSEKMIMAILGILKSGAAYVPIDPEYPEERIEYIEQDTKAKVTIDAAFLKNYQEELKKQESQYTRENLPIISRPDSLAYVIYTSGTTGQPKGVMIENKSVVNLSMNISIDKNTIFLITGSIAFDASTFEYFTNLFCGTRIVIISKIDLLDTSSLKFKIRKYKINSLWLTSPLLHVLIDEDLEIFKHIKKLYTGGDVVLPSKIKKLVDYNEIIQIVNGYGPTENTTFSSTYNIDNLNIQDPIPIGKAIPNTNIYILDSFNNFLPTGVLGRIFVSGTGLSRGYLNNSELTTKKFIDNPFVSNTKMYDTGDIGRWLPDGNIEFLGRKDFQIKIRGYRIELGEIKSKIQEFDENISEVVLKVVDGNDDKLLIAYYTLFTSEKNEDINQSDLKSFLLQKLPHYMVPKHYQKLERFPYNENGKIDLNKLSDPTINMSKDYILPRNEHEKLMLDIFKEVLNYKYIGVDDNFFELGGDSLSILKIINKVNSRLKIKLEFSDFYTPKISDIFVNTKYLDNEFSNDFNDLKEIEASNIQKRIIFESLYQDEDQYIIQFGLKIIGGMKYDILEKSFHNTIIEQPSLRSFFRIEGKGIIQKFEDAPHFNLNTIKIEKEKTGSIITHFFKKRINLNKYPLFNALLLKVDFNEDILLLKFHHSIFDGQSLSIFFNSVKYHYKTLIKNQESEIKILPSELLITKESPKATSSQYLTKLSKVSSIDIFPVLENNHKENSVKKIIAERFENVSQFLKQNKLTLNLYIMSVFVKTIRDFYEKKHIVFAVDIAGRNSNTDNLINMMVNTTLLSVEVSPLDSFEKIIENTRISFLECVENKHIGTDIIKNQLKHITSNRNPYQVIFTTQNRDLGIKDFEINGVTFEPVYFENEKIKEGIIISTYEDLDFFEIQATFNAGLYDDTSISDFFSEYFNNIKKLQYNEK